MEEAQEDESEGDSGRAHVTLANIIVTATSFHHDSDEQHSMFLDLPAAEGL